MCQCSTVPASSVTDDRSSWEDRALERSLATARDRSSVRARRLVDAARQLVAGGSSSFTIAEVAGAAGLSLRSFYRHFSGRDELLLALVEEEARTGAHVLREVLGEGGAPVARAQRCVEVFCDLVEAGSGYASLLVREHLRLGEEHPDELRAALEPLLDVIDAELQAAAEVGAFRVVDRFDAATVLTLVVTHVHIGGLLAPPERATGRRISDFCRAALIQIEETTS